MSAAEQPTSFGRIYPPHQVWLAKQSPEPILGPDLPIIDPPSPVGSAEPSVPARGISARCP
jgi:hypothetical protein